MDGLQEEFRGRALVLRADIQSDAGRTIATQFDVRGVPTYLVFDAEGELIYRDAGARGVPVTELRRALRAGARP